MAMLAIGGPIFVDAFQRLILRPAVQNSKPGGPKSA
jgi:hypothetical protein